VSSARARSALVACGVLFMVVGVAGMLNNARVTTPVNTAALAGALLVLTDLALLPVVLAVGALTTLVAARSRGPVRAALVISGGVGLVAAWGVWGQLHPVQPGNWTILPNNYAYSLLLILGPVWLLAALLAIAGAVRGRRAAPAAPAVLPPELPAAPATVVADRRWFLGSLAACSGVLAASMTGAHVDFLSRLALLPSRRADVNIQGLPVQTMAKFAGVVQQAVSPDYRLHVMGSAVKRPLVLTVDDLRRLPQRSAALPISCVQGWSVSAQWRGVPIHEVLALAGVTDFEEVVATSIQKRTRPAAMFTDTRLNRAHALHPDTLLALELNGSPLPLDHGYPTRIIAPSNPGIMNTKWVERLEIMLSKSSWEIK